MEVDIFSLFLSAWKMEVDNIFSLFLTTWKKKVDNIFPRRIFSSKKSARARILTEWKTVLSLKDTQLEKTP